MKFVVRAGVFLTVFSVIIPVLCVSATHRNDLVSAAWFAGWHDTVGFSLSNVSWSKYTHLTYAFSITNADGSISEDDLIPDFVDAAHKHGVKALVSIGGWTGGLYYSSNVATAQNRTAFVKTVTTFASKYKLDGVDFDWEYPGNQGIGCNVVNPNDTANFLAFLKELRRDPIGSKLILTAAASLFPWYDANGSPSTNLGGFANVLDYIAVMNYDIFGAWTSTAGPNAPLNNTCEPTLNDQGSAVSGIAAWITAGIPANKLVLGVPSYGHSFSVGVSSAYNNRGQLQSYPVFNASNQPLGDSWDDANPGPDVCGNPQGPEGVFDYWGLIVGGYLNTDGSPAKGISYTYDSCSQSPAVYNPSKQLWIAYDNKQSFAAKGNFIKNMGLRGFAMWEAGGDYKNQLLDSIREASGF